MLKGELSRGDITHILGMPERSARNIIRDLLDLGLLVSPTPKGSLRMGFPISAVEFYFPRLYVET